MARHLQLLILAALAVAVASARLSAQEGGRFKDKPSTPAEIWREIVLERDLGNHELAARWLRALMAKAPSDEDLLKIADKEGVMAFHRLSAIREWSLKDAKLNAQARTDSADLLRMVKEAIRKRAKDEGYIKGLINQLRAETEEERTYAVRELIRVGVTTVPYLLDEYARTADDGHRIWLRRTLERIGPSAAGPLAAGLSGYNQATKVEILGLLRRKHAASANEVIPFLWFPWANPAEDRAVRKLAGELLADLQEVPVSKLTPAKIALTREAERYLNHQVRFVEPIRVWRWDGKAVVEGLPGGAASTPANVEGYYTALFGKQALSLDPDYEPAQAVLLLLSLERAAEGGGKAPDALASIINKADLGLLLGLLDRALREGRANAAVPLIQAIGKRAEVRALRPLTRGDPPLVRALDYPDLSVRLAAVEALLGIPGPPPPHTIRRVLEVLRTALSPAATSSTTAIRPRTLVAIGDDGWRARVVRAVGPSAIEARTGRDAIRKMKEDGSIQALITESTLPLPGLAHFLAQLRADPALKNIPVLLAAVPESRASVEALQRYSDLAREREGILRQCRALIEDLASAQRERDEELRQAFKERAFFPESFRTAVARLDAEFEEKRKDLTADTPDLIKQLRLLEGRHADLMALMELKPFNLSETARKDFEIANERFEAKKHELERKNIVAALAYRRLDDVEARMRKEEARFDLEAAIREGSLARFVSRYPGVKVVHPGALKSERELREALASVRRAAPPPPTAAAMGANAEWALRILHRLATNNPPGYDITPLSDVALDALRNGKLSEAGQLDAIGVAQRLPGSRAQSELADVVTNPGRPARARLAAADGLIQSLQKHGNTLPAAARASIKDLAAQPGLNAELKEKAELLAGILHGGTRGTGEGLKGYDPRPVPPVIPPPKEKEKEKEKEED
jgi:hypothetical protein